MQEETVLIAGCGDLGERLAPQLQARGWDCAGLRRNPARLPPGVRPLAADLCDPATLGELPRLQPQVLVFTPTPAGRGEAGYRAGFATAAANLVDALGRRPPRLALLVSSTRVYAERDGGWVDEASPLHEEDPGAAAIIAAERAFIEGFPRALVLRAGGLYGKGPGYLLERVAAGRLSAAEPPRFSNRMHRDDLAGCMLHAIAGGCEGLQVVNAVDDAPVPLQEVERWLCEQLHKPYAPPATGEAAAHKRVGNARLRGSGASLRYPDYRAGYDDVLRRWLAHSEREDSLDLH